MNPLILFLIKSSLWLCAFALVYHLFLSNQRFFLLNRLFLFTGLISSVLLPFITFGFPSQTIEFNADSGMIIADMPIARGVIMEADSNNINWLAILNYVFFAGLCLFLIKLGYQTVLVVKEIYNSYQINQNSIKVIKTNRYSVPFSFFSYVFVPNSTPEINIKEIVNHESEHIRQHHFIDLVLCELVCLLQWFNPVAWIYGHFIRQNHEYLADTMALKSTENPAVYRAVLINQILGGEAIRLGHMFSYSLNKKRFNMMTQKSTSALQKLRLLWVIPVALLVIFACTKLDENFGEPESMVTSSSFIPPRENGMVYFIDGTITDVNEEVLKEVLTPDKIASIIIYKGDEALENFGNIGKNGVIEIKSKNGDFVSILSKFHKNNIVNKTTQVPQDVPRTDDGEEVFKTVETMPEFPGGIAALQQYLANSIIYPAEAAEQKIEGRVYVQFIINKNGDTESVKIVRGVHELIDNEAKIVVEAMPTWKPGLQRNIPVAVSYTVPINFVLN